MKMWKKAASLALASALVVSLAACGSNGNDAGSSGSDVFMIGGIGPTTGAVSYTHLDVYKRQQNGTASGY